MAMERMGAARKLVICGCLLLPQLGTASGADNSAPSGVTLPAMDAKRGRELFVSKGCVACHAVNGVGGMKGAPLDAATMDPSGNLFEFFSRMWLGAGPMIETQEKMLGQQVDLTAQELADIVAFIHDAGEQKEFSEREIPEDIEELIEGDD